MLPRTPAPWTRITGSRVGSFSPRTLITLSWNPSAVVNGTTRSETAAVIRPSSLTRCFLNSRCRADLAGLAAVHHPLRGPLGQRRDGERWVHRQRCRNHRPVYHEQAGMTPDLAAVVDHTGGRIVAHRASAQRVGGEDLPHRPAVQEAGREPAARRLADGGHHFLHLSVQLAVADDAPADVDPDSVADQPHLAVGAVGSHTEER